MKLIPKKILVSKISIKKRWSERRKLMNIFIKEYKKPVIIHATHYLKTFEKILDEKMIKLPEEHNSPRISPYLQKFLKTENAIYYSLNFDYALAYGFKYNFIFDLGYLKDLRYYSNAVAYKSYITVARYWYEHDKEYLEKLRNYNEKTKEVIDKFLNTPFNGKKRRLLDFWKIEEILFNFIQKYPDKKKLFRIIKEKERELRVNYPYSIRKAKEEYKTDKAIELIGFKNNDLAKNQYFLGFYIVGAIPKKSMSRLKKDFNDKILFDGKKIKEISKL